MELSVFNLGQRL